MRGRVFFLFLLLALPVAGYGQSTLNFPKFFSAAELPNSGFAIVNPGPTAANVTFTLFGQDGSVISTSTSQTEPPLPAGAQRALSGDQIFTTLGSGGWVQVTSTTSGLQGFWLNYDGALTYLDGAEAASTAKQQIIPLVAGSTELSIANPNASSTTVSIELHAADGSQIRSTVNQPLAVNGVFHSDAFSLFGVSDSTVQAQARYVRITSSNANALAATALIRNFLVPVESGVVNGIDQTSSTIQLNFPHVISGPLNGPNYTTVLGVTNLSSTAQPVTVKFTPASGSATTQTIQLPANGSYRDTAATLFGFPAGVFQNGWIQVSATAPIAGFAAYADLVGGALALVPAKPAAATNLVFPHIANLYPVDLWQTGIALLNPGTTTANVEVYAMTPAGVLIGGATTDPTASFQLAPGTKSALGLSQMIPEAALASVNPTDGGFVFVRTTNGVPIYGIELFYNSNVTILANVAGEAIPAGSYTPPAPAGPAQPLTLTTLSPNKVQRGGTITLTGTGFSTTPASDAVVFQSVSGTVSATPTGATSTSLTLVVPALAISGPVTVQTGGQTSSPVVLEVLATTSTFLQSSVSVTAGSTLSGVDIYVEPPVISGTSALNATLVGTAPIGSGSIPFGETSAIVTRGTLQQLLVYGSGVTKANGSILTVSGTGVTVNSVAFGTLSDGSPYMVAQIAIDANAAMGPRNLIVTNSNLDISVVSGGLIIQ